MTVPRFNPLIRNEKYLTQLGQLKTMTRTVTGDAVVTATNTVTCLVYMEEDEQDQTNPAITLLNRHHAILPFSVRATTKVHDHLATVTDRFGNVVLLDSRIVKIVDYNHWRHEPRFFVAQLDVDLD